MLVWGEKKVGRRKCGSNDERAGNLNENENPISYSELIEEEETGFRNKINKSRISCRGRFLLCTKHKSQRNAACNKFNPTAEEPFQGQ